MIDLRLALPDQDIVGNQPVFTKCREHGDKNRGNLAVYQDHVHCFVCGFTIGLRGKRDPLAYLLKVDALTPEETAKYTVESIDRYRTRAAEEASLDPLPKSLAKVYNAVLHGVRSSRLKWFYDRGLLDQTIDQFQLGHNGTQFVIPVFDQSGNLVALRYRMDPEYYTEAEIGKHKYMGMKGRNGRYLYPEQALTQDLDTLYICEGELDAVRMWQEGRPAVTVTNGAGQVEKIPGILAERYPNVKSLILATDQDDPGEEAAQRTIKVAQDMGFNAYRLTWIGGKDVTEHLLGVAA